MIRVEDLKKRYNRNTVFKDISFTVNDGEVVGIIGSSGSGKSLLLRCMLMLERPDEGKIYLDDEEITAKGCDINMVHKRIGMVFQNSNLFEHLSVVENVMTGQVHLDKIPVNEAFERSMVLLRAVGLADEAFSYPRVLSGGQQQRAAIARTLALNPEIIFMDEPTSSLDPLMKGEVEAVIRNLAAQGHTMVIVSHEVEFVRQVCTKVVFLHEGTILAEGTPETILDNPEDPEIRRFVTSARLLVFDIRTGDFDFIGMQTEIREYAFRNGIPDSIREKLLSVSEELVQMEIIQPGEMNIMHMIFEYNPKEGCLYGDIRFSGPPLDPDDPVYFFSWPIIRMHSSELSNSYIQEDGYTNKIRLKLI